MARKSRRGTTEPSLEGAEALAGRVVELEAELRAAHRTIGALLDKVEGREPADAPERPPRRLEEILDLRNREVEEKSAALDAANLELRNLMTNFDKIVRQRNRALVESETQLRRKNDELKMINELKTEFISIAAHELRTPLTSIVGYIELMTEGAFGKLPPSLLKPVDMARRSTARLVRLVDEMLDLSRIDAGTIVLRRTACDLKEIVSGVVAVLEPVAALHQQHLELEVGIEPVTIDADADKISQVINNLLASALRHSAEQGRVTVTVDRAPREQFAGHWARVRVRDTGQGIPRRLRDRLFEPFSDLASAKHHTSTVPDSAGLGLYIARGLVDLHGGIISVKPEDDVTVVTVLFPLPAG